MPAPTNARVEKDLELCCVNCGWGLRRLFMQYSPGNIRLMKCENCKCVADPYIECEFMIILIDLILHKTKAYRHLLYNILNLEAGQFKGILWKSTLVYFLLDTCRILLLKGNKDDWDSSGNLLLSIWTCGKALTYVLMGNLMFISVLLLGTRAMLNPSFGITRHKDIWLAILLSSYFKLYLVAMLVWEFPPSVAYIVDIFVLSSNAVALRVLTRSRTSGCFGVCLTAHAAKYFTTHWLLSVSPDSF